MAYRTSEENGEYIVNCDGLRDRDAFVDAARGTFSLLYDIEKSRGQNERIKIVVEAKTPEELLSTWLSELIERQVIYDIVFADFSIVSIQKIGTSQYLLTGAARGEAYDRKKHTFPRPGLEVKKKGMSCSSSGKQQYRCEFHVRKLQS